MVTAHEWSSDWLRDNSLRAYPLMDGCSGTSNDSGGSFTLPASFLLDLSFPVKSAASPTGFQIMNVASYSSGYVVTIGAAGTAVAAFTVTRTGHAWGDIYAVVGVGDYEGYTGRVAIGSLDDIDQEAPGVWSFDAADAAIQPRCLLPMAAGLAGIQVSSGGDLSAVLTGVVTIEQGSNCRLSVTGGDTIVISAVGNEDYSADCSCTGQRELGDPIRTINGISPTAAGDFILSAGQCIALSNISNGQRIADDCASPCCGCEELQVVNNALQAVSNQVTTLTAYASRLEAKQDSMETILTQSLAHYPSSS